MDSEWPDIELTASPQADQGPAIRVLSVIASLVLVAGVVAAATVGGGSSNSSPNSPAAQQLSAAANKTLSAKTAKFTTSTNIGVNVAGRSQTILETATGVVDFVTHEESVTLNVPGSTFQERVTGGYIYLELPAVLRSRIGLSTPWAAIPLPKVAGSANVASALSGSTDPSGTLRALIGNSRGGVTGANQVGQETIGGVSTTKYAMTVNAAALNQIAQGAVRQLIPGAPSSTLSNLALDLWIDAAGLVRRIASAVDVTTSVSGQTIRDHTSIITNYADFGAPITIQAPPANQVTHRSTISGLLPVGASGSA